MIDLEKLRAATAELGYAPATTDEAHLAKLRADNERHDRMNAADPDGKKWRKMAPRTLDDYLETRPVDRARVDRLKDEMRAQQEGYRDNL